MIQTSCFVNHGSYGAVPKPVFDIMDTDYAEEALAQMFMQAKMQFGSAIKGFWFYKPDPCPGCGGEIDAGKTVESNGFVA